MVNVERPPLLRYGLVVVAVALALLLRWPLWAVLGSDLPFLLLWPVVMLCGWYGGLAPGLFATGLSALGGGSFLFLTHPASGRARDGFSLVVFVAFGALLSLLNEYLHRARRRSAAAEDRLRVALEERERLLARARERAEEVETIMDLLPVPVFLAEGADCRRITGNRAGRELLRAARDQNVSLTPGDGAPPAYYKLCHEGREIAPQDLPMQHAARLGAEVRDVEVEFVFDDGAVRSALGYAAPLHGPGGDVRGCVAAFVDITERKKLNQELRRAHERFRLAAEAVNGIIYDHDLRTGVVERTRGLGEVLGYRPDQAGKARDWWRGLIHPDDLARADEEWQRALEAGAVRVTREYRMRHADGHFVRIQDRAMVLRGPDGPVARLVGCAQDVTALRQAEERNRFLADCGAALATATPQLDPTLQTVARLAVPTLADFCLVHLAGEDGRLRPVAEAHAEEEKEALLRELAHGPEQSAGLAAALEGVVRDGLPHCADEASLPALRPLGPRSWLLLPLTARGRTLGCLTLAAAGSGRRYGEADLDFAGELARRAALAVDNARLYREARAADRRKEEFLAVLGHELRNPLAPIVNALQVLRLQGSPAGEAPRQMIERQVRQMTRLVDDLLDVARVSQGKLRLRKQRVDLAEVVAQAVEASRPVAEARGHRLVSAAPGPLPVEGDPARLAQVLGNLLNNAAKYTPNGGLIEVSAGREDGEAVVRVRDNGVGIAREMQGKVFDLFTQGERAAAGGPGGLGVGLSLVRSLVEMHGGRARVSSPGPGGGSEFTVHLPLLNGAPPRPDEGPRPAQPPAQAPLRALVVDDNRDAAESLALLLRAWGHEACVAHDGRAALEAARAFRPEVVFLDVGLPGGMTGHEVARRLRHEPGLERALIVALTGYGQEEDRRQSREAGMDHHLTKPAEPEALRRLLAARAAGRQGAAPVAAAAR